MNAVIIIIAVFRYYGQERGALLFTSHFLKKIFSIFCFAALHHQGKGTAFEAAGLRIGQTIISVDGRPMQGENLRRPFFVFVFLNFLPFFFAMNFCSHIILPFLSIRTLSTTSIVFHFCATIHRPVDSSYIYI